MLHLRNLDTDLSVFGATTHEYLLNDVVSLKKISAFETKYKIKLPNEYVEFLTKTGNGGAGPHYGVAPFKDCLFADLDYKTPDGFLNPSEPFAHSHKSAR